MTVTGTELREHLVAAIEAAPELEREDREHLADVFLDQLRAEYTLVPRAMAPRPQSSTPSGRRSGGGTWVPLALVFGFLIFVVPAAFHTHLPTVGLVVIAVLFAVKSGILSGRHCQPAQQ